MSPTPTENSEIYIRSVEVKQQGFDRNQSTLHVSTKDAFKKKAVVNDLSAVVDTKEFAKEYENEFDPPTFTIKELRDAIPPPLFEKNILISSTYVIVNLMICFALFYVATLFESLLSTSLLFFSWPLYWWFQGIFATGIWVLAHECGHQSFSNSKQINNAVGLVLHSLLLVPYHPWRISHASHHAATGNLSKDEVFVPKRRSEVEAKNKKNNNDETQDSAWEEALEDAPLYSFFKVTRYLLFGWPAYLLTHRTGQKYPVQTNHFITSSPIFEKRHRGQVLVSDAGLVIVIGAISYAVYATSFWTVSKYYLIPYLFVNGWLVTITLLQHTDVYLPHYTQNSWNFVRGALTTVDRDYGWFLNHALHHIQDSHVAHHLFSQMPHYNAVKATPYLKEKLGKYYLYDRTPVFKALVRAAGKCVFVEDTGDVLFYRNK